MDVVFDYMPIRMPVGEQTKGRLLNVIGETIDGMKPLIIPSGLNIGRKRMFS